MSRPFGNKNKKPAKTKYPITLKPTQKSRSKCLYPATFRRKWKCHGKCEECSNYNERFFKDRGGRLPSVN